MNIQEHIEATIANPEHIYDVPLTILREAWPMVVAEAVSKAGRVKRQSALRANGRRNSSGTIDEELNAAMERATKEVAAVRKKRSIWDEKLLDMEFPVCQNGEVKRLGEFTVQDFQARREMLMQDASGLLLGVTTIDQAIEDIAMAGVSTLYQVVSHATS